MPVCMIAAGKKSVCTVYTSKWSAAYVKPTPGEAVRAAKADVYKELEEIDARSEELRKILEELNELV